MFGTVIKYKNRENDTVSVTSNADWFDVLSAVTWDGDSGQIYFTITGLNTTETVSSATITFQAVNHPELVETMIVDWLPRELHYGGNGGSKTLTLLNNGLQVTAQNGYWASFTTTEHTITFTAPPNLVSYMNSGATNATQPGGYIWLIQDGGGSDLKVEPNVLYYDTTGGSKYVTVTCSNSWVITSKPEWLTVSSMDGSPGQTMLLVTASENEGAFSRTGEIIFSDGRGTATVTAQQLGNSTVRALSANPQTVMAASSPSSYTVDVFYANRNGDFVSITPSSAVDWYSASTISWTGDTGRFELYVADNESVDMRSVTFTLSAITGEVSTTVVLQQAGDEPFINLVPSAITYDATGGTKALTAEANVPWDIDINDTQ